MCRKINSTKYGLIRLSLNRMSACRNIIEDTPGQLSPHIIGPYYSISPLADKPHANTFPTISDQFSCLPAEACNEQERCGHQISSFQDCGVDSRTFPAAGIADSNASLQLDILLPRWQSLIRPPRLHELPEVVLTQPYQCQHKMINTLRVSQVRSASDGVLL